MDFPRFDRSRPRLAATVLGFVALGAAGPAAAQSNGYSGPMLSWAGKTAAPVTAPPPPAPMAMPSAPVGDEATAYVAPPRRAAPAQRYVAPPEDRSPPTQDETRTSVPAPPPAAPATAYVARARPPAPQEAPPTQVAQATPNPTPAVSDSSRVPPRLYSLHREYGMTPDPIAMPKDRGMVLVGPPDEAKKETPDDAAAAENGDSDKSAKHGDGQGSGADDQPGDN